MINVALGDKAQNVRSKAQGWQDVPVIRIGKVRTILILLNPKAYGLMP